MKFNEKLIELRRKEGLSQEELGYKLNVTRQTISKWELGQTTPEMDKLIELSKVFNVSVDDLINNSETPKNETTQIEDEPIINQEENKREKYMKLIITVILAVVIMLILIKLITSFSTSSIFNKITNLQDKTTNSQANIENMFKNVFDTALGIIDKASDNIEQENSEISNNTRSEADNENNNMYNQLKEEVNNRINKQDVSDFNFYFSNINGTQSGFMLKNSLDKIITINKTKERKITFKYNEIETQDPEVIKETKKKIDDRKNYEISVDYDEDGYINLITVENL